VEGPGRAVTTHRQPEITQLLSCDSGMRLHDRRKHSALRAERRCPAVLCGDRALVLVASVVAVVRADE